MFRYSFVVCRAHKKTELSMFLLPYVPVHPSKRGQKVASIIADCWYGNRNLQFPNILGQTRGVSE